MNVWYKKTILYLKMGNAQFQVATSLNTGGYYNKTNRWFRVDIPWFGIDYAGIRQRIEGDFGPVFTADIETTGAEVTMDEGVVFCTFRWTRPPARGGAAPSLTRPGTADVGIRVQCFSMRDSRLCGPRQFLLNASKISGSNIAERELNVLMRRIAACFDNATEVQLTDIGTYI